MHPLRVIAIELAMLLAATSAAFSAEGMWDRLGWFGDKNAKITQTENDKIRCKLVARGLVYDGKTKGPFVDVRKNRDGAFTTYLHGLRGDTGTIDLTVESDDGVFGKLTGDYNSSGSSIVRLGCIALSVICGLVAVFFFPPAVPLCVAAVAALTQFPSLLGALETVVWGFIGVLILISLVWVGFKIKSYRLAQSALYNMTRGIKGAMFDGSIDSAKTMSHAVRFMSSDEQKIAGV